MTKSYTRNEKVVLFVVFLFQVAFMGYMTFFSRFLSHLGFMPSSISFIAILYPLAIVIFGPLWGRLSDKYHDRKKLLALGTLCSVVLFFALTWITPNVNLFAIPALFGCGAVSSANLTLSISVFADDSGGDPRKLALLNALTATGNAIGAYFFGVLLQAFNIQTFGIWCGVFAMLSLCFVFGITQVKAHPVQEGTQELNQPMSPDYKRLLLAIFFRFVGIFAVFSVSSNIMVARGLDESQVGFLVSLNPLCQIVLMLVMGKLLQKISFKAMFLAGTLFSTLTLVLFGKSSDFYAFAVTHIVLSVSYATLWSAMLYYLAETTTAANRGQFTGLMTSAVYLGHVVGNALFAVLLLGLSSYDVPIYVAAIMPMISFGLILRHKFQIAQKPA